LLSLPGFLRDKVAPTVQFMLFSPLFNFSSRLVSRFGLLIYLSISSTALFGQNTASVFWEIRHPKQEKPSYLFGTHHLHDYQFLVDNPAIQTPLREVDFVVGEMIVDSTDLTLLLKLTMGMFMKENSLQKLLSEADYKATDQCLRENVGIGIALFNKCKPIVLQQLISIAKYMKAVKGKSIQMQANSSPSLDSGSMDAYFQQVAKKYKKQVKGLESIDDQIRVLYDGYPIQRQVEMLLDAVYDRNEGSIEELNKLEQLYNTQDLDALYAMLCSQMDEQGLNNMLFDRNIKWIPQLDQIFRQGKTAFIAVGAGHLPGEKGLLGLLQAQGYQLTPITIAIE